MDGEDDPPFDDGGSPPDDGEQWFDDDEPVSGGDTEVHARLEPEDDGDEDRGRPVRGGALAEQRVRGLTRRGGARGPAGEDEPASPTATTSRPHPRSAAEEEEPGEIEPLTPENIERMLHERAPFFLDPDEPATDSELEAVEGEDDASARRRRGASRPRERRSAGAPRAGAREAPPRGPAAAARAGRGPRRPDRVIVVVTSGSSTPPASSTAGGSRAAHAGKGPSYLSVATDPTAVPQNVLIADRNNSRIISISPKGQVVWTHAVSAPSDAYLSYTGHTAVITQHTKSRIFTLEVDPGIVNYIYGHSDKAGSADNYLHDPQTAQEMPGSGEIVIADLGNCRILFVRPNDPRPGPLARRQRDRLRASRALGALHLLQARRRVPQLRRQRRPRRHRAQPGMGRRVRQVAQAAGPDQAERRGLHRSL